MKIDMKKHFLVALLFFTCESQTEFVQEKTSKYLSEQVLTNRKGIINSIPIEFYTPVFAISKDNKIIATRTDYLFRVYSNMPLSSRSKNFDDFLFEVLNQRAKIDTNALKSNEFEIIILDEKVKTNYEKMGFEFFWNNYLINTTKPYLNVHKITDNGQLCSVIYYLFLNNYCIVEDDYYSKIFVKKWDDVIKNAIN